MLLRIVVLHLPSERQVPLRAGPRAAPGRGTEQRIALLSIMMDAEDASVAHDAITIESLAEQIRATPPESAALSVGL